jgi:4-amino-4-deoxy-L-arabinose transferase-like glycosyltransferase
LIPTLEGETRVKKPPLTAWITAWAIRPQTVTALSDPDPGVRRAAADDLAVQARWPSLLAACLMLVAVYELGRVVADDDEATGVVAALIAGSNLMFLRFGRTATIDVHLGLWVMVANVFLSHAILRRRYWLGCMGAGIALGLAFLTKGPVAWVQSLVPVIVYLVAMAVWRREHVGLRWIAPAVVGVGLMLAIGSPWYVYVSRHVPGAMDTWLHEAVDERGEKPSSVFGYLAVFALLLPWTVAFVGGVVSARRGMVLAVFLALAPLVVLTLYKDRKERYAYPMTGSACVVAAGGVMTLARKREEWNVLDKAMVVQHWGLVVVFGVVLPAVAATTLTPWLVTVEGRPWLSREWGVGISAGLAVLIAGGMLVRRRWVGAMVGCTVLAMLVVHGAVVRGYARTDNGRSTMRPLAEAVWARYPDARMYNAHPKGKRAGVDLSIYLNRVTEWVSMEELGRLRAGERPLVVVMLQDGGQPEPRPPQGWVYVGKVMRDRKDWYWAFGLPTAK